MGNMTFASFVSRLWLRRFLWALTGLLLLWVLAWLVVPPLLKGQLEKVGSEKLGRQVQVGRVDFHPWTLALTLDGLSIAGPAVGAAPQLRIQHVLVDVALWQSLRRLAPVVDAISVQQPELKIIHLGGGRYDFDDIVARLSTPSEPQPSPTPSFALYNISLTGGSVDFVDQPVGKTHAVRDLRLSLPFFSNLDSQRSIQAEPRLAFILNGSSFDTAAQTTPFIPTRKTDAHLVLKNLDLAPYLPYLPASLPVRVQGAVVGADLQLTFEETPKMSVRLRGVLQADQVRVANPQGTPWLALDTLKLALDDVRPLEGVVKLSSVELLAPAVDMRRDAAGNLGFLASPNAAKNVAPGAGGKSASDPTATDAVAPQPWQISVAKFALNKGSLRWSDGSIRPAALVALHDVALDATAIAWPFSQPLQFSGQAQVDDGSTGGAKAAELRFSGSATDQEASIDASLGGLPLGLASPYLASVLEPRLSGQLDADVQMHWKAPDALQLTAKQLTLDGLVLTAASADGKAAAALASLRQLQLVQAQVDMAQRSIRIGKLSLTGPRMKVERGADQRWMFERWVKKQAATQADMPVASSTSATSSATAKPWGISIADFALEGGAVSYIDRAAAQPVSLEVTALQVQMKDLDPASAKPSPLNIAARIGAGNVEAGRLAYKGMLALQPLAAQGQVDLSHLPLHALEPYFGAGLNVDVVRADTSFKGQVAYATGTTGPVLKVRGDGTLEEFRANRATDSQTPDAGASPGRELLSWKLLNLRGVDVAMSPGAATRVEVKETALSDFYARVVVDESGRINLQDLVKPSATTAPSTSLPATNTVAASAGTVSARSESPIKDAAPVVRIGAISLVNGRVQFSDRFIKPNYSANLSELTGKLGAFSSVADQGVVQQADLELRGRAEGTASLEILGKLNPLAKPLVLDINAKVRDLELPALTPYSIKYAGHGIERGKLSVDVHYVVQPDGQLTAANSIILNQLVFGDEVAGAPASLPVKLAVALLADRNGVIDLNLPLSGSINDPQFRIGPVIFKIIGNLIAKAITSPFSLLASAFGGGGDELSVVYFVPGSAVLMPEARENLDKVAKALEARNALKLTVVGSASAEAEREALQKARLQRRVLAEKRRNAVVGGAAAPDADAGELASIAVDPAEYPALLKSLYKRASFPKPRNALGLLKDLPDTEMEQLLLANLPASDDALQRLAVQRGVVVRDYLASQKIPLERLFLGAAKTQSTEATWKPQAELQLAMP
jgi:hypothetical protein